LPALLKICHENNWRHIDKVPVILSIAGTFEDLPVIQLEALDKVPVKIGITDIF
jgi:hypothetical protein